MSDSYQHPTSHTAIYTPAERARRDASPWTRVQGLLAPFYWEDVVSMVVIALHTAYLASWLFDLVPAREQMLLALAAYVSYVVNAGQFLLKFREARASGNDLKGAAHWAGATE